MNTTPRFELRTNTGARITSSVDHLSTGVPLDPLTQDEDRYTLNYADVETQPDYDYPETYFVGGEMVFEDENGHLHLAGDINIVQVNPDGTETDLNRTFTDGYQKPRTRELFHSDPARIRRALELATWVAEATDESIYRGFLTPAARQRITNRAREYAEAEGLTSMLNGILNATNPQN